MSLPQTIDWEIEIRPLGNRLVIGAWLKAMAATWLVSMIIVGAVFAGSGEWQALPMLALALGLTALGLGILGLLIMGLLLGNRLRLGFSVGPHGIRYRTLDARMRALSRLAVGGGLLAASPAAAGAGLLATANEDMTLTWAGSFRLREHPRQHTLALHNGWRDLVHLYCLPENYHRVRALIEHHIVTHGTAQRLQERRSPLPATLLGSAGILLASLPLFALGEITRLDLLLPILIMLFALATAWLIPLFGWVVMPMLLYVLGHTGMAMFEQHTLQLVSTYRYRRYELLDGGEWILLAAALVGGAWLWRVAWRAVRGRLVPLLFRDFEDRG